MERCWAGAKHPTNVPWRNVRRSCFSFLLPKRVTLGRSFMRSPSRYSVTADQTTRSPREQHMTIDQHNDLEAIRQLKARYFRLMDTRQWDLLSECFAADK